jgi:rhodanese-related sulfurtransferase
MTGYQTFRAEELPSLDPNESIILDVRTGMEHAEKRLAFGHAHVPLDALKPADFMMRHGLDKDFGVYILCGSGKRAAQAAEKFVADGYRNIHVIEGGIIACEDCGHDMKGHGTGTSANGVKAKGPISLERQVRIAAGAIAATGALLGLTVNPLFGVIPLFAGGGLMFAGMTDRCGMALVLTKAPWNRMSDSAACATTGCAASAKTGSSVGSKVGQSYRSRTSNGF